jgi:Anti-sigma-K factor rskA
MNDEDLYAEYLEHGPDAPRTDALDAATRDELDVLRRVLTSGEVWTDPPDDLAEAVVAQVRDARGGSPARATPAREPRGRKWMPLVLAAAAVVVVVALAGVVVGRDGDAADRVALSATDIDPDASGSVSVEQTGSGLSLSLSIGNLPPAAPGTFYQAWMKGPDGSVPIGTFHARETDRPIALWSGVDIADYPTMTVTIQDEGAGPESSGRVVLTADLRSAH